MCQFFKVSRSGYYDFIRRLGRPDKDAALAKIIAEQRKRSFGTYGYRRMWLWLKSQNIYRNPKTVLRIMKKDKKINPMVGGAGISAFPMSARVIQKMALKEDNQNHLLMHAVGANVAGQIGSVVAGGIILTVVPRLIGA